MEVLQPRVRQGSKRTTADADKQPRFGARVVQLRLEPPETLHSDPSSLSPLHVKWKVSGQGKKNKAAFSAAPLTQALRQSGKIPACVFAVTMGRDFHPASAARQCLLKQILRLEWCQTADAACASCLPCLSARRCPTLSALSLVFLAASARAAGTAVPPVPVAF